MRHYGTSIDVDGASKSKDLYKIKKEIRNGFKESKFSVIILVIEYTQDI